MFDLSIQIVNDMDQIGLGFGASENDQDGFQWDRNDLYLI
jgi:hypothetical protein